MKSVHVYSNEVTVELLPWKTAEGLKEAIEGLHIHYLPGVTPSIHPDGIVSSANELL